MIKKQNIISKERVSQRSIKRWEDEKKVWAWGHHESFRLSCKLLLLLRRYLLTSSLTHSTIHFETSESTKTRLWERGERERKWESEQHRRTDNHIETRREKKIVKKIQGNFKTQDFIEKETIDLKFKSRVSSRDGKKYEVNNGEKKWVYKILFIKCYLFLKINRKKY